jgi:hypothetical protein
VRLLAHAILSFQERISETRSSPGAIIALAIVLAVVVQVSLLLLNYYKFIQDVGY